jgi:SAM-dependent methyltransferase
MNGKPRGRDRELEVGARAHYEDPGYYSSLYARRAEDVAFYARLAARHGGPILEYGVGNGRVALPMARAGAQVTGIDHSAAMLRDFRERLKDEPEDVRARVSLVRGDMRRVKLGRRFPLVVSPFNAVLHLYERKDVEAFLARVREHLRPRGSFIMDISMPMPEDLARDPMRAYHAPRFLHPTLREVVKNWEYFDYDRWRQVLFVSAVFERVARRGEQWSVPLAHRQFFPQEWAALLHYNGFEVERVEGDFRGGPVDRSSDVTVWYARVRRGWRPR